MDVISSKANIPPLPEYTVRESARARYFRIKVSARDGVQVIVPRGFDRSRIPGLVRERQQWIANATRHVAEQRLLLEREALAGLPDEVTLRALGETWKVEYRATSAPWVAAVEAGAGRLFVRGAVADAEACREALRRWVLRRASASLVPWLERVSRELKLPFTKAVVRSQRTRWGSCSKHGTISLNCKLLFLPPELARYIFIHELCHTIHFNHSSRFWAAVRKRQPDCQTTKAALHKAWRYVPGWMYPPAG
ncbi:MAG: M48 family metallopeptidase [Bacteroidetes bacterium]|nr:M48 family metallopeptidase [Bacteroidota bacterium]MCL5027038.1 M48 family metallopeptidase [Chloroflexota bacterium]